MEDGGEEGDALEGWAEASAVEGGKEAWAAVAGACRQNKVTARSWWYHLMQCHLSPGTAVEVPGSTSIWLQREAAPLPLHTRMQVCSAVPTAARLPITKKH